MGFSMLRGQPAAVDAKTTQSLTPLILFAASPGTITGVITISVAHTQMKLPVTSLVAIVVATGMTWLAMVLVAHFGGKAGGGGFLRDTLTRFMGLIVLSMGVQFALTGYRAFMK
jgi:multiple antibiotic resistance protein